MKKQALFIAAIGALALGSCETNVENHDEAYIDSVVNARVEEMRMEMMMQNDSLIYALAQEKADSMIAAMKGGNTVTTKTTTTRTTRVRDDGGTTTTTSPGTIGNGKPKMGGSNDDGTIGNGKPKMGGSNDNGTIGNGKPKMGGGN